MRILIMGDGPWTPSGFGNVVRYISKNLAKDENFKVSILSWQHMGQEFKWGNIKIYGRGNHNFGVDILMNVFDKEKPDILLTMGDFWMTNYLANENWQKELKKRKIKWVWYLPLDTEIMLDAYRPIMKIPDKIVSMAQFAKRIFDANGFETIYIPHGVDVNVYKPLDNKDECRDKWLGFHDKFIIGCNNRNQDRKQLPRLAEAFALFAKNKNDVHLRLHCDKFDFANIVNDYQGEGHPILLGVIGHLGIGYKVSFNERLTNIFQTPLQYAPIIKPKELCEIYNSYHIHANPTSGEGFGLTTIESNACGVPNVITDYTSSRELVEGYGELVPYDILTWGTYGTWRAMISVPKMAIAFEKLYMDWKNDGPILKEYSRKCVEMASQYDWQKFIIPLWKILFKEVYEE